MISFEDVSPIVVVDDTNVNTRRTTNDPSPSNVRNPRLEELKRNIKIHDSDDLYRKHIIRKLASQIDVPEISCTKRKKALQYGSKIHKALLKTR